MVANIALVKVGCSCPFCGKLNYLLLEESKLRRWRLGALVQDVFPELSPSERELLITGICDDCFPSE